jgi:hypothetical protein
VPWAEVEVPNELLLQLFPFVEEALAGLKSSTPVNYGTINFLELLQQLRPFFWRVCHSCIPAPTNLNSVILILQVTAAIYNTFPTSPIFKRVKVLQTAEAAAFFAQWPAAREVKEADNRAVNELGSAFRESATQSAFVALAARHTSLEAALRSQSVQLDVLTRRTEPLSPSRLREHGPNRITFQTQHRYRDASPNLADVSPNLADVTNNTACAACSVHVSPSHCDQSLPAPPVSLPSVSSSNLTGSTPTRKNGQDAHPAANILHPVAVVHNSKTYSVLQLSSGPLSPYTPFDMILPEPAAFCDAMSMSLAQYPTFMANIHSPKLQLDLDS